MAKHDEEYLKREEEYRKLKKVLSDFSEIMLNKLMKKYDECGCIGWDRKDFKETLILGLGEHIHKYYSNNFSSSSLIDIANYCMFLWNLNSNIKKETKQWTKKH